ncbi:uncharacterized protein LOC135112770 [Scylla paramamosain]|uniref:uncharacterized protein LOC135112770 n=1 Tax=Scylla paramamosain TaxID=85552 RepID=UPI003082CD1B
MKCAVASVVVVVVAAAALGEARPSDTVFNYEGQDHKHYQKGETGRKVEGYYSWFSPEGQEFYVKYVADELGYRVLESNALPVSSWGATPDGHQGNLEPYHGDAQAADAAH